MAKSPHAQAAERRGKCFLSQTQGLRWPVKGLVKRGVEHDPRLGVSIAPGYKWDKWGQCPLVTGWDEPPSTAGGAQMIGRYRNLINENSNN